jgi:hypothetical protein
MSTHAERKEAYRKKVLAEAPKKEAKKKHIVNFLANLSDADSKIIVDHLKSLINQGNP